MTSLLKNTAKLEKRDMFMKNGNEGRDVFGESRKRYRTRGKVSCFLQRFFQLRKESLFLHPCSVTTS